MHPVVVCFNINKRAIPSDLLVDCRAELVFSKSTDILEREMPCDVAAFVFALHGNVARDFELADAVRQILLGVPAILAGEDRDEARALWAMRHGYRDCVTLPEEFPYLVKKIKQFVGASILRHMHVGQNPRPKHARGTLDLIGKVVEPIPNRIEDIVEYIQRHYAQELPVTMLADACNMSYESFLGHFKKLVGHTVRDYVKFLRMSAAKSLLKNSKIPTKAIAFRVGYNDVALFYRLFRKEAGLTPGDFRVSNFKGRYAPNGEKIVANEE